VYTALVCSSYLRVSMAYNRAARAYISPQIEIPTPKSVGIYDTEGDNWALKRA